MGDDKHNPEQDPSEGSRETVERELSRTPDNDNGSIKKPDMPEGARGGTRNT